MAKARVYMKRRKAVRNIRKITRTMQLIATARYQKIYQRATRTKPYTQKIEQLVADLSSVAGEVSHPLLRQPTGAAQGGTAPRHVVLVLTSNRGLCGGYNANVLHLGLEKVRELKAAGQPLQLEVSGKKGIAYFKFLQIPAAQTFTHLGDDVKYAEIAAVAQRYMDEFSAGQVDSVSVAYMRFLSTASQKPALVRLLPLEPPTRTEGPAGAPVATVQYEFTPDPQALLGELLPQAVKARLFQCFMDAAVSEQVARMVAMKAATDAAGDMIRLLTRQYNRARQTQITTELMEIIGGAEAMA